MNDNKIVLDASALLALLNEEPGHIEVEKSLKHAVISSVNFSEVVAVLMDIGISHDNAECMVVDLLQEIVPFDQTQASTAAALRKQTKPYGLSLGDRACLALGKTLHATILTADKMWAKLTLPSVRVKLIR